MDFQYLIELNTDGWKAENLVEKWAIAKQKLFSLLSDACSRKEEGEKLERYFSEDVLKNYKEFEKLQPGDENFDGNRFLLINTWNFSEILEVQDVCAKNIIVLMMELIVPKARLALDSSRFVITCDVGFILFWFI